MSLLRSAPSTPRYLYVYTMSVYCLSCFFSALCFVGVGGVGSFKNAGPLYVDPECYMNSSQLIADNGFVPETHSLTTKDGYILQIFRVRPKKGRLNVKPSDKLCKVSSDSSLLFKSAPEHIQ